MAIYIKGMELPKEQDYITITVFSDRNVYAAYIDAIEHHRYEKFTTATEIPEPHGRLIDADRVVNNIPSDEAPFCKYLIMNVVLSAPTVIEGSER